NKIPLRQNLTEEAKSVRADSHTVINRVFPIYSGWQGRFLLIHIGGKMDPLLLIPMVIILVVVFFYLGWMFNSKIGKKSIVSAEDRAKQIIADAQKESNNIKREKLLEVKDEWYKKKIEFDNEVNQKRQKLAN